MTEQTKSPDVCSNCMKPRRPASYGSVTQWVFSSLYCSCGIKSPGEASVRSGAKSQGEIEFCSKCGMRKSTGRAGSITDWIFRQGLCTCQVPAKLLVRNLGAPPAVTPIEEPEAEEAIPDLSSLDFPFERYKPIKILSASLVASVLKCYDRQLMRLVAVKVMHMVSGEVLVQFQTEAKALARLNHPGIVTTLDFGTTSGYRPYMVMSYLQGRPLNQVLLERGQLSSSECIAIMRSIASALAYAHKHGILHRDIKPANIIVSFQEDGELGSATLIDFGLAYIRKDSLVQQTSTLAGTPLYMSPDVVSGLSYDARSELYSLACVVYELLAGRPPFEADTTLQLFNLHAVLEPPAIPWELEEPHSEFEAIIKKSLSKSPESRFQSMDELMTAIDAIESDAYSDTAFELGTFQTSSKIPLMLCVATVLLALIIGVNYATNRHDSQPEIRSQKELDATSGAVSVASMAPLIDITDEFIDQRKQKDADRVGDVCEFRGKAFLLNGKFASDDFIEQLDLPSQVITEVSIGYGSVTDRGLEALSRKFTELRSMYLDRLPNVTEKGVSEILKRTMKLKSLTLFEMRNVKAPILNTISTQRALETLYFRGVPLKGGNVDQLTALSELRRIGFRYCQLDNENFQLLATFKKLVVVDVTGSDINDKSLMQLVALPDLQVLLIAGCTRLSPKTIQQFSKQVPQCQIYSDLPYKTGHHLEMLLTDDYLRRHCFPDNDGGLDCAQWSITDNGVKFITHLPLRKLNVSDTKISDTGLAKISSIKSLRELHLSELKAITSVGLKNLSTLRQLKSLSIAGNEQLSDQSIAKLLCELPALTYLDASKSGFGRRSLEAIAKKKSLKRLYVSFNNLNDEDVAYIASHFPYLEELNLQHNSIASEKSLMALTSLKSLKELSLGPLKDQLVAKSLKEQLRNCKLVVALYSALYDGKKIRLPSPQSDRQKGYL